MVWEDRNSLAELKKSGDSIDRPAGDAERRNKDKQTCFCITENKQKNTPTHSTGRVFLLTSLKKNGNKMYIQICEGTVRQWNNPKRE